ncbi:MAG: cation-transporting P-type ATPase, partial [bacterium]|nr:cation-transporting P-type ATPase [bacterium]
MPVQETKTQDAATPLIWHSQMLEVVLHNLKVEPKQGLPEKEVEARRGAYGKNILPKGKKTTALEMIWRQFTSPLVYILIIAAGLTWWIKEYADMIIILVVVAGNAVIGFFQEYRASKIFEKLKEIVRVEAMVIRDGLLRTVDSELLVPGDIIMLKGGNKVPADSRLLEGSDLEVNEALLTGESKPTRKKPGTIQARTLVSDRHNMVFMGTVIENGDGQAVVVATGARTEIGQISVLTQSTADEQSPLQERVAKLAGFLTKLFVAISTIIFAVGILEGDPWTEMFKTTIAVAVAAIPEGLPAVISIILAVSAKKILEKKGLVMKLIAAETLGSTSVVCADKTGTLTYGRMVVEILTPSPSPEGEGGIGPVERTGDDALLAMALANEAVITSADEGVVAVKGEATDKAKLEYALAKSGKSLAEILETQPRLALLPFDSDRKYLASFHNASNKLKIYVSGAPETILEKSLLSEAQKSEIQKNYENLANRGYRVIALAIRNLSSPHLPSPTRGEELIPLITELTYLGLAAIRDPIRQDVKEALTITRKAGVKVIMITGDHVLTAKSIGLELGFGISGPAVVTGQELDSMSELELQSRIGKVEIVARATPVHKMRIIASWQKLGAVVAMTGDGVNDAPALKAADIGVAVGTGTDVAKEASELILLDDSFATMTAAIKEGRTGFSNIRKATVVVMSNAFTEIVLITASLIFRVPFPITAIMILWVNLVEDGLPVLALAFEPSEEKIMQRVPLSPAEPILDREAKFIIFAVGILSDLTLFGIFIYLLKILHWDIIQIQSFIFVAAATPTLINILAFKSLREPITKINLFNNRLLIVSIAFGFVLMLLAIYSPFLNKFLTTVPLPFWPAAFALILFPLFKLTLVELTKWWYR